MEATLNYIESGYLVSKSPYISLVSPSSAKSFIDRFYYTVLNYQHLLKEYPAAKYEQLEIAYFTIQNIGLLDEQLVDDFFNLSYRGGCWAAWLISLQPDVRYLDTLKGFIENCHIKNRWIAELAISSISNAKHPYLTKIHKIQELVGNLPKEEIALRKWPTKAEIRLIEDEKKRTRTCYKTNGADSAIEYLNGTRFKYYFQDYNSWQKNQRKL